MISDVIDAAINDVDDVIDVMIVVIIGTMQRGRARTGSGTYIEALEGIEDGLGMSARRIWWQSR